MSDRAPDNQPTDSIERMLKHAEADLDYWVRSREAHEKAVVNQTDIIIRQRKSVNGLKAQLKTRLAEEEAKEQELTGL